MDPDVGPFSRVKRKHRSESKLGNNNKFQLQEGEAETTSSSKED